MYKNAFSMPREYTALVDVHTAIIWGFTHQENTQFICDVCHLRWDCGRNTAATAQV